MGGGGAPMNPSNSYNMAEIIQWPGKADGGD
jgi:hypothetical protein